MNDQTTNDITVIKEETEKRISFCVNCEHNILDVIPKCDECNCSISMLTTLNFKTCPIGKW
jgi:hypothetical protein